MGWLMGRKKRQRPARLGEKLLEVRNSLDLSQTEMWKRLGLEDQCTYYAISHYEKGTEEPSLITILKYSRLAKVRVEVLIDDELELPSHLPNPNPPEKRRVSG